MQEEFKSRQQKQGQDSKNLLDKILGLAVKDIMDSSVQGTLVRASGSVD